MQSDLIRSVGQMDETYRSNQSRDSPDEMHDTSIHQTTHRDDGKRSIIHVD